MSSDQPRFGPPIRHGALEVRPTSDAAELAEVMALRALAFRGDAGADDRDAHDVHCLHLRVGGQGAPPLATLRLQLHPQGRITGYAAGHYDLGALAAAPGPALELGRLCLHPEAHDPGLVRLLWAGVTRLAERGGAARLIGCVSFPGADPARHAAGLGWLARRHLGPAGLRPGLRSARTRMLADWAGHAHPEAAAQLPAQLRAYLALGGWVSDHLVIDPDLETCHVFTCIEIATMPEGRKRVLRALAGG